MTLFVYGKMSHFYTSQEFKVSSQSKRVELRQQRWLELAKDFDHIINYHPRKENIVVDALSQKSSSTLAYVGRFYMPQLLTI